MWRVRPHSYSPGGFPAGIHTKEGRDSNNAKDRFRAAESVLSTPVSAPEGEAAEQPAVRVEGGRRALHRAEHRVLVLGVERVRLLLKRPHLLHVAGALGERV